MTPDPLSTQEGRRLAEHKVKLKNWKLWGPYLSERQWATVREDYSAKGSSWDYLSHDQSRSRAYRWGEDGLLGITDRHCRLCWALALWNGEDSMLKERLFGLTNSEGNHGEDCKECYYYLDSTPTHSYMKALYKYPQRRFPYSELVEQNRTRSRDQPEYELKDTGVFADSRYWDVLVEYCKSDENDILCRYTVTNRGPEPATLVLLPTLWFRNTWSWGPIREGVETQPKIQYCEKTQAFLVTHDSLPDLVWYTAPDPDGEKPQTLFTDNETDWAGVETSLAESIQAPRRESLLARKACPGEAELPPPPLLGKHLPQSSTADTAVAGSPRKRARLLDESDAAGSTSSSSETMHRSGRQKLARQRGSTAGSSSSTLADSGRMTASQDVPHLPSAGRGYYKNAFHKYFVNGDKNAVSPDLLGTKAAAAYRLVSVPPGERRQIRCRLMPTRAASCEEDAFGSKFDATFDTRLREADEFYNCVITKQDAQAYNISRQAYAGLLWNKQFFYYIVRDWLIGDPNSARPPRERLSGRNSGWQHLYNRHILSMPDKWEYPWYAAWDTAFHMIPFASIDVEFAKKQLLYFLSERYMHPNGQIPAYEFCFGDVNPPVHAWSVMEVYKKTGRSGQRDTTFLASCFQKLLLNFSWWVNQKDPKGRNLFGGGFLGLDNITVFDRSLPLAPGDYLEQADGTGWMAFYCAIMFNMSCKLASEQTAYEGMASKFLEHFLLIADAINEGYGKQGGQQLQPEPQAASAGLWDDGDGFYYDRLLLSDGTPRPIKVRSLVGLVPLFGVAVLKKEQLKSLTHFYKRLKWFLKYREDLGKSYFTLSEYANSSTEKSNRILLLALPTKEQFLRIMKYVLDENEFLSPYGIRSLSKHYAEHPYLFDYNGKEHRVDYTPAESTSNLFGGNSNWRGPIWLSMNYLIIDSLRQYHAHYGDSLKIECPTGSGILMTLKDVANEIGRRVTRLFVPDNNGRRPAHGDAEEYTKDPAWRDLVLFYEYFDGDTGRGCGASHQTGWTALVVECFRHISR